MFANVLLAVDLNEATSYKRALPAALALCKTEGATLHLLTVAAEINEHIASYFPSDANDKLRVEAERALAAFAKKNVAPDLRVQTYVRQGPIWREILSAAEEADADIIVMASHRPAISDYLLGANAAQVVRHFARSVMVVRD